MCGCVSKVHISVQTYSEEERILAHSLNWFEEVSADLLLSLTAEQHAALDIKDNTQITT